MTTPIEDQAATIADPLKDSLDDRIRQLRVAAINYSNGDEKLAKRTVEWLAADEFSATIAELRERLRDAEKLTEQLHAKMTCMCGSDINHSAWEGHSPVSMYDYALEAAEARATAAERALVESDAATATLSAQNEALRKALEYARPLVEKWCFYQGDNQQFVEDTLAPIRAALSLPAPEPSKVAALVEAVKEFVRLRKLWAYNPYKYAHEYAEAWDALDDAARAVTGEPFDEK